MTRWLTRLKISPHELALICTFIYRFSKKQHDDVMDVLSVYISIRTFSLWSPEATAVRFSMHNTRIHKLLTIYHYLLPVLLTIGDVIKFIAGPLRSTIVQVLPTTFLHNFCITGSVDFPEFINEYLMTDCDISVNSSAYCNETQVSRCAASRRAPSLVHFDFISAYSVQLPTHVLYYVHMLCCVPTVKVPQFSTFHSYVSTVQHVPRMLNSESTTWNLIREEAKYNVLNTQVLKHRQIFLTSIFISNSSRIQPVPKDYHDETLKAFLNQKTLHFLRCWWSHQHT